MWKSSIIIVVVSTLLLCGMTQAVMLDVTGPGGIVQGVPNDGDWPAAEHPALAIDDDVNTKYLHFKGDFDPDPNTGGAGLQITPAAGPSIISELTFTTANDVPGRDPIAFELYGSNESIDGPYELITAGDIVDFADPNAEWPRFTKNETPIVVDSNGVAYDHYQIIFTAIRGPVGGSVNSMQIAEIELLGESKYAKMPVPTDGATGISPTPVISTFDSGDVPKDIPDWSWTTQKNILGEVTSTLDVSDSIAIKDLNVELDITMPGGSNGDLNVYLKSPDGKKVKLFDDIGVMTSHFTNTILDDEAGSSITGAKGPYRGIYKPEGKLSDFDGRDSQGTWELEIIDDWPGGPGKLNSWRIVIENPITVSWVPGFDNASYDVYFSSSYDDVNDSVALLANVPGDVGTLDVGTLELATTYYWRVDTIGNDGTITVGDIWSFSTPLGNVVIDKRIADEEDDSEEDLNPDKLGENDQNSSDLEMPYEDTGMGDPQIIGLRYRDVGLTAGISLIEAWVRFQVDELKDGSLPVNLMIEGELNPNPAPFIEAPAGTFDISSRPRTETKVLWSVPEWLNVGDQGPAQTTSDLTPIIEEIISQPDWAPGNALVFIISDDPCNPSEGNRCAEAGPGNDSALLHVVAISEAARNPSPADGVIDVVQETILSWSPGFTGGSRDVYFGTESPPAKLETTTGTSYNVGKLDVSTTYYWKIDEYDADGNKHDGPVWSFTTVIGEATNPDPADGAKAVALDVALSWTPGGTAVSHDVYFGTSDSPELVGNQVETSYDPNGLEPGTTYYWRVDAIEADGTTHIGEVWSFTTITLTAYDPIPADGATEVATDIQLSWTPGLDAKLHAVYFGDDLDAVTEAEGATPLPLLTYDPGPLEEGKTYYWRVDEVNPPTTTKGDIWSFTTVAPPEPEPEPEPEPKP